MYLKLRKETRDDKLLTKRGTIVLRKVFLFKSVLATEQFRTNY